MCEDIARSHPPRTHPACQKHSKGFKNKKGRRGRTDIAGISATSLVQRLTKSSLSAALMPILSQTTVICDGGRHSETREEFRRRGRLQQRRQGP